MCSRVVLPDPLVPISATCSPSLSSKRATSITGTVVPSGAMYFLLKFSIRIATRALQVQPYLPSQRAGGKEVAGSLSRAVNCQSCPMLELQIPRIRDHENQDSDGEPHPQTLKDE